MRASVCYMRAAGSAVGVTLACLAALAMHGGCVPPSLDGGCGDFVLDCGGQPVIAVAGEDREISIGTAESSAIVELDGSLSFTRENPPLDFIWTRESDGAVVAEQATPTLELSSGTHLLRLTVTDAAGNVAADQVQISVVRAATQPGMPCGLLDAPSMALMLIGMCALTRVGCHARACVPQPR